MFSLWCKLVFDGEDIKSKIKKFINFVCIYILPTSIAIIISDKVLVIGQYYLSDTIINIISLNLLYSGIIHIYIQKNLFHSLEKDVIVKFVPQKLNIYIILRILMIFIKIYMRVITLSILAFKDVFTNYNYTFYICSIIFIVSIIFFNVIIAIFYRYLLSVINNITCKVINLISFIYISTLFVYQSFITPIWYLESLERYLKNDYITINKIHMNFFQIILIMIIFMISIMGIKCLKNFLNIIGRNLISIKNITINNKSNKITKVIETYCETVYSFYFSNIGKSFFSKDIKETIRENKYTLLFICFYNVINSGSVLFFFLADNINNIEIAIISCKISLGIVIVQIFISYFLGRMSFEKNINIDIDYKVLRNYNIKVTINEIIKVKTKVLSSIVFPKVLSVFSIIIISSLIIYSNIYLALIYFILMIQLLFLKETIQLWLVKSINKFNSNKIIIEILNTTLISIAFGIVIYVYFCTEKIQFIYGQLLLLTILISLYLFNLFINKEKINVRNK
ncbi:hypothetical protein [Clostridium tertium]|uniref:Uncharacterized protein n=1 Tax=Clostridium tertium TaxID=1559 RepID=A0A6N3DPY9_9CLOT